MGIFDKKVTEWEVTNKQILDRYIREFPSKVKEDGVVDQKHFKKWKKKNKYD